MTEEQHPNDLWESYMDVPHTITRTKVWSVKHANFDNFLDTPPFIDSNGTLQPYIEVNTKDSSKYGRHTEFVFPVSMKSIHAYLVANPHMVSDDVAIAVGIDDDDHRGIVESLSVLELVDETDEQLDERIAEYQKRRFNSYRSSQRYKKRREKAFNDDTEKALYLKLKKKFEP